MATLPDWMYMPPLNASALENAVVVDKEATKRNQQQKWLGITPEVDEQLKAIAAQQQQQQTEKETAEKKAFLEGFDDPYGEKSEQERQRKEKERKERLAKIRANADKRTWVDGKVVEDPAKTDPFLEGFNGSSNEQKLKFPNTQIQAAPKNTTADDEFREGFNDPYGEKEKEEKSKWQKVLDGISVGLTGASFIPGLDTITNLIQVPVDLLRGDFAGAGLDLVGAIPFVGEIADIGKNARTADRIIDGVRATDRLLKMSCLFKYHLKNRLT